MDLYHYSQLVKTPTKNWIESRTKTAHVVKESCALNARPIGPSRTVNISPLSNDPRAVSANWGWNDACPYQDADGDGLLEFVFYLNFHSLYDIGTWELVCNGYYVTPGQTTTDGNGKTIPCCFGVQNACGWNCYAECLTAFSNTVVIDVNAYNNPPSITAMSASPSPARCPGTATLSSTASDQDHGTAGMQSFWSGRAPSGTSSSLGAGATTTMRIGGAGSVGNWTLQLDVDDPEGERATRTQALGVSTGPFTLTLSGKSTLDVTRDPIRIDAKSDACGTPTISWDIVQAPPLATRQPQEAFATSPQLSFPTAESDIGTWTFRATATMEGFTDTKTYTVEVRNLPPRIAFSPASPQAVRVGTPLQVGTTVLEDDDGGALTFDWELIQAPASAGVVPGRGYSSSSSIHVPTGDAAAGTWRWRLRATDDDGATNSTVESEPFLVVVDAAPTAVVSGAALTVAGQALLLDGSESADPDSPCQDDPVRCHVVEPGETVQGISPGVIAYAWYVDVPFSLWTRYLSGRVADALGVPDDGPVLSIDALEPGDWVFRLEVVDGEGNVASDTWAVTVVDVVAPPMAILTPPRRYEVGASGETQAAISVSGAASYDPDNQSSGDVGLGTGITEYAWDVTPPPFCSASPAASGESTLTLFPAGAVISPDCQGTWRVQLTVTDDDQPPETATTETDVVIGNCAEMLCIDAPTTVAPRIVPLWDETDVTVVYRLDAALYDDPRFAYGMITELTLTSETDPLAVVTQLDPDVLPFPPGGLLAFNWNGYTSTGERPPGGFYDVRIRLLTASGADSGAESLEPRAVWMEVPQMTASTATRYVDRDAIALGAAVPRFSYALDGALGADEVRWRIRDAAGVVVYEISGPGAAFGDVVWSGYSTAGATLAPAGIYSFEAEAYREGMLLAASEPVSFALYTLRLEAVGRVAGPNGLPVLVNGDDDDHDGIADGLETAVVGEDDLLPLQLVVEPDLNGVLTLDASGAGALAVWGDVAKAAAVPLPATYPAGAALFPPHLFVEALGDARASLGVSLLLADGTLLAGPAIQLDLTSFVVHVSVTSPSGTTFVVDPATSLVTIDASWTSGTSSLPAWSVTPGPNSGAAPPAGTGAHYEFTPTPEAHATFDRGNNACTGCGAAWWMTANPALTPDANCGHGCNGHLFTPQPRFAYSITATLDGAPRTVDVAQDEIDAIQQQYLEHQRLGWNMPIPSRANFLPATVGSGYWGDVFRMRAYAYTLGDPEPFANEVLAAYRRLANDEELIPAAYGRHVGAGVAFLRNRRGIVMQPSGTFDLPLRTPLCWDGQAVVPNCGDTLVNGVISAGPDGIARTRLRMVNYDLRVSSGWRSPEHNEAIGGVLTSRHQLANALDLGPQITLPATRAQTWCLLKQAAGSVARPPLTTYAQTENGPASSCPCTDAGVNHVHVDVH